MDFLCLCISKGNLDITKGAICNAPRIVQVHDAPCNLEVQMLSVWMYQTHVEHFKSFSFSLSNRCFPHFPSPPPWPFHPLVQRPPPPNHQLRPQDRQLRHGLFTLAVAKRLVSHSIVQPHHLEARRLHGCSVIEQRSSPSRTWWRATMRTLAVQWASMKWCRRLEQRGTCKETGCPKEKALLLGKNTMRPTTVV